MIDKSAELLHGELPEVVKDLLWDDEAGFFENTFMWGGRGLMLASWPWAVLNVVAGLAGFGLEDLGKLIDKKLAGVDPATADPKALANELAEELYPKLEARAALLQKGIVIMAADPKLRPSVPKPISFESTQPEPAKKPAKRPAPAAVDLDPPANWGWPSAPPTPSSTVPPVSQPPPATDKTEKKNKRTFDEKEFKRKEKLKAKFKKKVNEHKALMTQLTDKSHAKTEAKKFHRERIYMEEQMKFKNEMELKARKEARNYEMHRDFMQGKITPDQYRTLHNASNGNYLSDKDLDALQKRMGKTERESLKKRLALDDIKHKNDLKHAKEHAALERKNAKYMSAAKSGNSGIMSIFKGKVGKLGVAAALAALLFAGFKAMTGQQRGYSGQAISPTVTNEPSRQTVRPSKPPATTPHSTNKGSRNMGQYINKELKSILGD